MAIAYELSTGQQLQNVLCEFSVKGSKQIKLGINGRLERTETELAPNWDTAERILSIEAEQASNQFYLGDTGALAYHLSLFGRDRRPKGIVTNVGLSARISHPFAAFFFDEAIKSWRFIVVFKQSEPRPGPVHDRALVKAFGYQCDRLAEQLVLARMRPIDQLNQTALDQFALIEDQAAHIAIDYQYQIMAVKQQYLCLLAQLAGPSFAF